MSLAELRSADEVTAAIAAAPQVLLEMWGTHCAPCRALRPLLDKMAELRTDWSFSAINIEAIDGVADEYSVRGTPTILLFKDGKEVGRTAGFIMPEDLEVRLLEAELA